MVVGQSQENGIGYKEGGIHMSAEQFAQLFREEHREIRDTPLELIQAFQDRDKTAIQSLLTTAAVLAGPHFCYEEEALYPGLVEFFGQEYVEQLLQDHDRVIGTAMKLTELANADALTDQDVGEATRLIRRILPHVSDCDGLSIMVERMSEDGVQSILDSRRRSREAGLNLVEWVERVRERAVPALT